MSNYVKEVVIVTDNIDKHFLDDVFKKFIYEADAKGIYWDSINVDSVESIEDLGDSAKKRLKKLSKQSCELGEGKLLILFSEKGKDVLDCSDFEYELVSPKTFNLIMEEAKSIRNSI